jgi:hypothetical protein
MGLHPGPRPPLRHASRDGFVRPPAHWDRSGKDAITLKLHVELMEVSGIMETLHETRNSRC